MPKTLTWADRKRVAVHALKFTDQLFDFAEAADLDPDHVLGIAINYLMERADVEKVAWVKECEDEIQRTISQHYPGCSSVDHGE